MDLKSLEGAAIEFSPEAHFVSVVNPPVRYQIVEYQVSP